MLVGEIVGPRVEAFHVTQEVLRDIRKIEHGEADVPVLQVETQDYHLILGENRTATLHAWQVLKLGAFSTCRVLRVNLSSPSRRLNASAIAALDKETAIVGRELRRELEEGEVEERDAEDPEEDPGEAGEEEALEPAQQVQPGQPAWNLQR